MGAKAIKVTVEMPEGVSDEARETAESRARETIVLTLWERSELTIREAAEELGLTYREFLDLAAVEGIPIERGELNIEAIEQASGKLNSGHQ